MINRTEFYSNSIANHEEINFKNTKDFMYSKELHIMLHGFCTKVRDEDKELMQLVDTCFTERGSGEDDSDRYLDVWKISKILLDIFNGDFSEFKEIFASNQLKVYFKRFLGGFYNYFFAEYQPYRIDVNNFVYGMNASALIAEKQGLLALITDTFSTIMNNLEKNDGQ